jgi:DNA-binding NarL/FixJ family response regulator
MARAVIARPVRVAMIGGHPVVRGVVRLACDSIDGRFLEDPIDAASIDDVHRLAPDVVVVDLDDSAIDGRFVLRQLRDAGVEGAVLALSDRADGRAVLDALRYGVHGYLTKSDGLRELGPALERLARGERLLPRDLEQAAVEEMGRFARRSRESAEAKSILTDREIDVLRHMADGMTTRQIGRRMGISARTVETHVSKLYRKLGVRSRVQAVSRAATLDLIDLG